MKRLIICADGTWNTPEKEGDDKQGSSTNVLKMLRAIKTVSSDGVHQVRYYAQGVGTNNWVDSLKGGAFGFGLSDNVLECYRFLANNYAPGDEIYIFGFSRGAFTARSLGGLLGTIGLIHPRRLGKLPDGWHYYRMMHEERKGPEGQKLLKLLGERTEKVAIDCLGVWDTVGALGIPVAGLRGIGASKFKFHDVKLGSQVKTALHAVAIDEQRKSFAPSLWEQANAVDGQVLEQVWFPGVHSNIGGGYSDQSLADVSLQWMIERVRHHTSLDFDDTFVAENVHPNPSGTLYNSRKGFWGFLPGNVRTVPAGATMHSSVDERRRASVKPAYDPENIPPL